MICLLFIKNSIKHIILKNNNNISNKKADLIRFNNTDKLLSQNKKDIIELLLWIWCLNCLNTKKENSKKWLFYYYTISKLIKYNIHLFNNIFKTELQNILNNLKKNIKLTEIIGFGVEIIEKISYLQILDDKLYDHQKELFTYCKYPNPKLIHIAPTGTGKTMSPLGLSEKYKVHIKYWCYYHWQNMQYLCKKVALLLAVMMVYTTYYYTAKDYTMKKNQGIGRVDNTVGIK